MPRLLVHFYLENLTGILRLKSDSYEVTIYFVNGYPVFASSNNVEMTLGRILLDQNKISEKNYQKAIKKLSAAKAREEDARLGDILIKAGFLTPNDVNKALTEQLIRNIMRCFSWDQGEYAIEINSDFINDIIILKTTPESIILRGIKKHYHIDRLESMIAPLLSKFFTFKETFIDKKDDYRFAKSEHLLLSLIDGTNDLSDLMARSNLSAEEVLQTMFALSLTDVLDVHDERAEQPVNIFEMGEDGPSEDISPGQQVAAEDIVKNYLNLKSKNYYQLLGINPDV